MKTSYHSLRNYVYAVAAVVLLALGFNRASAQIDPVCTHTSDDPLPETAGLPCICCVETES